MNLLDVDLKKLWNNDIPEEDFLNLFTKLSIDLLAIPANTKSKSVKKCLVEILALLILRYQQRQNVSGSLMEALFKYDHVIIPMTELLQYLIKEFPDDEIVGDFMNEIGRMDPGNNRADASGAKNIAKFVVSIAEVMPRSLLPYVSLIIPHLANEVRKFFFYNFDFKFDFFCFSLILFEMVLLKLWDTLFVMVFLLKKEMKKSNIVINLLKY